MHLQLEVKRLQAELAMNSEAAKKYKTLKADYRDLLETFERSEEIRQEQKAMINDQKNQVRALKVKVKE